MNYCSFKTKKLWIFTSWKYHNTLRNKTKQVNINSVLLLNGNKYSLGLSNIGYLFFINYYLLFFLSAVFTFCISILFFLISMISLSVLITVPDVLFKVNLGHKVLGHLWSLYKISLYAVNLKNSIEENLFRKIKLFSLPTSIN